MTTAVPARRRGVPRISFRAVPPSLRPALRAFLLGFASTVGPRLVSLLARYVKSKRAATDENEKIRIADSLRAVLASGFGWNRFPAFCALFVGGSTFLEIPVRRLLRKILGSGVSTLTLTRLGRWFSTFFSAALSLRLLQSRRTAAYIEVTPEKAADAPGAQAKTVIYGGRTLDLTLFAAARAVDVIVRAAWTRSAGNSKSKAASIIGKLADPVVFSLSSAAIMWAWFFTPANLPRSYRQWISSAAAVDNRLIEALRRCRNRELRYGEETGQAPLLSSMCQDYDLPLEWGDPVVTTPFPCELVHMGCGPSCELHAVSRFYRSFRWSLATYLPLSFALQLRNKPSAAAFRKTLLSAARSSLFLGTFITLFYYGVCLARTRIGPRVIGTDREARNKIDGGICVGTGCALCGWSILLEAERRRPELALFVTPRALATFLPRRYPVEKEWREVVTFAASAAVLVCAAAEDKEAVRGVFGRLVRKVLER